MKIVSAWAPVGIVAARARIAAVLVMSLALAVPMGDHGARHRVDRVDVKIAGLAVDPGGSCLDPASGPRRDKRHPEPLGSKLGRRYQARDGI
jgi:hypothetical protein